MKLVMGYGFSKRTIRKIWKLTAIFDIIKINA